VKTKLVEVTNSVGDQHRNFGKFMLGVFDQDELKRTSVVDGYSLVWGRGWGPGHILVLDLQTGEGAIFKIGGSAKHDLDKHKVWVCPLFEPFLEWLYLQPDPMNVPDHVNLPEAEFAMSGYRRSGPEQLTADDHESLVEALDELDETLCQCKDADADADAVRVRSLRSRIAASGVALLGEPPRKHWPDCAMNHGGSECDMGPECGTEDA